MNIALVLSGGNGSRVGAEIPKQYIEVNGKMIISYSLKVLEACRSIDAIWIVAEEMWQDRIKEGGCTKLKGFSKPGLTRQLSIINGLKDICSWANESDIVVIHDAARPFVTEKLLERVILAAGQHQGAMPVLKMKDTVYYSKDGRNVSSLLDRSCIYAGQAPEAFLLGSYYDANMKLSEGEILKINGSTEPAIMAGLDIVMVEGEEENFKLTTREDLERFSQLSDFIKDGQGRLTQDALKVAMEGEHC